MPLMLSDKGTRELVKRAQTLETKVRKVAAENKATIERVTTTVATVGGAAGIAYLAAKYPNYESPFLGIPLPLLLGLVGLGATVSGAIKDPTAELLLSGLSNGMLAAYAADYMAEMALGDNATLSIGEAAGYSHPAGYRDAETK